MEDSLAQTFLINERIDARLLFLLRKPLAISEESEYNGKEGKRTSYPVLQVTSCLKRCICATTQQLLPFSHN
jgi:hypothetical protein